MRLPRLQSMLSRSGPWVGRRLLVACALLLAALGLVAADGLRERAERAAFLLSALGFLSALVLAGHRRWRTSPEGRVLEAVFRASPLPIFTLDRAGRVEGHWNPAAQRRFGLSRSTALGGPMPVALQGFKEVLDRAFGGESIAGVQGLGLPGSGPSFPLDLHLAPIRGTGGRVEAVLVIVLDLTESRDLKEQLLHSQKLETVGEFLSVVTHDYNNILMSILGHNELLLMDPHLSPDQRRRLEIMRRGASRGHALAARLLRYARRSGSERLNTDLNELVSEVMALLRESAGPAVLFQCQLDPHLPSALVEPTEIHQVIMNLGVNARDAMPAGGRLTFRTRVAGPGEAGSLGLPGRGDPVILLEIQDTGQGIPAEVRERMFEPFFTTKAEGKGTGLGLAVVDRIVKAHGGLVRCSSRDGEGALFQVLLPATRTPST